MSGRKSFLRSLALRVKSDVVFYWRSLAASFERHYAVASPMLNFQTMSREESLKVRKYELVKIKDEVDVALWETQSDYRRGGNSVCSVHLGKSGESGHMDFSGDLRFDRELDYKDELFAEAVLRRLPRKKFRGFNGLQVEVKTDGNPYRLHLVDYLYFNTEMFFVGLTQIDIVDKSKQWTVLEAPLANFRNGAAPRSMIACMPSDLSMLHTLLGLRLGIYSPRQRTGPFALSLRTVSLIYRPEFETINYDLPFMIKSSEELASAQYVDTGHSLIDIRRVKPNKEKVVLSYPESNDQSPEGK